MSRVTQRVVVAAVVADLDRVATGLQLGVVGIEVRARSGVEAGVAVVVGVGVLDQAVVAGEGEDAVLVVGPCGHAVDHEAVGLQDVERVELGLLHGEVAQVEPAEPVRTDRVQLRELVVDQDVGHQPPGADDLGAAERAVAVDRVVVGRLVTEAARVLLGKHKPTFAPHLDTGDHVIVVNAPKVVLTASMAYQKDVVRHSLVQQIVKAYDAYGSGPRQ